MKHLLTIFLAALLCVCLIACGNAGTIDSSASGSGPDTTAAVIPAEDVIQSASSLPEPVSSWPVTEDITASLLQKEYPADVQKITVVLENRGEDTLTYGQPVSIEKYTDGQWTPVPSACGDFRSEAFFLRPQEIRTLTTNLNFQDEPWSEGLYRLVSGPIWTGEPPAEGTVYPAWQLEFRVTGEARQEPDFAVYVPGSPLLNPENIPVHIINTTGEDSSILLIPRLDRRTENGQWEEVPFAENVGFCGMSDPLRTDGMTLSEPAKTLWGFLAAGHYRISFDMTGGETAVRTAGGEFDLDWVEPEICQLPTADASR